MRILRSIDYRMTPATTGDGVIQEIACSATAGMPDGDWRITRSFMASPPACPVMDGYIRSTSVIGGGTMRLSGRWPITLPPGERPRTFPADWELDAEITAPLIELSVVSRKASTRHWMNRCMIDRAGVLKVKGRIAFHYVDTPLIAGDGEAAVELNPGDTIISDRPGTMIPIRADGVARLYEIGIGRA